MTQHHNISTSIGLSIVVSETFGVGSYLNICALIYFSIFATKYGDEQKVIMDRTTCRRVDCGFYWMLYRYVFFINNIFPRCFVNKLMLLLVPVT